MKPEPSSSSGPGDDIDKAFAEIVAANFPQGFSYVTPDRSQPAMPPVHQEPEPLDSPFLVPPDPHAYESPEELDGPYWPSRLPRMRRWPWATRAGVGLLGVVIVVVSCSLSGLRLPSWAGLGAAICFTAGSVLLFSQLPRHQPPPEDDGARL